MRRLRLTEYATAAGVALRQDEAARLRLLLPSLSVAPSLAGPGLYDLTPGSAIGVVVAGDLEVEIRPKVPLERVMFLVSYAVDPRGWRDALVPLPEAASLVEAVVPTFVRLVARATKLGLLHGYRPEEDAMMSVRGQIRFPDQIRERLGLAPPVEVRYDEYTPDIQENRLLRAALRRLARLRLRSVLTARALREVAAAFDPVTDVEYDPRRLPDVPVTRLNRHYEPALRMAKLILRGASLELGFGGAGGTAFLLDMNEVFEAFMHRAIQEALGLTDAEFRRGSGGLRLDEAGRVRLEPDLSWWRGGRCVWVGDAKYKRLSGRGFQHADLYQMLAYCTAADLPSGLLIYAAGEAEPAAHAVRHGGQRLLVDVLDVGGPPAAVLAEVRRVAASISAAVAAHSPAG